MASEPANDALEQARLLAEAHRLRIVPVSQRIGFDELRRPIYGPAYVVYRKGAPGCGGVRLGRRRDPRELLAFVRKLTGPRP